VEGEDPVGQDVAGDGVVARQLDRPPGVGVGDDEHLLGPERPGGRGRARGRDDPACGEEMCALPHRLLFPPGSDLVLSVVTTPSGRGFEANVEGAQPTCARFAKAQAAYPNAFFSNPQFAIT